MNKLFLNFNNKKSKTNKFIGSSSRSGFTLIETLIAVLILTLSIGGLLSLAAGGLYSVRYSRNQIVANNLLQESLEYIRNTRDTALLQGNSFLQWQDIMMVDSNGAGSSDGCFGTSGCILNPYSASPNIKQCLGTCPYILYYPDNQFYGYDAIYPFTAISASYQTSFIRTIKMEGSGSGSETVTVIATMSWLNGSNTKTLSQTIILTDWDL